MEKILEQFNTGLPFPEVFPPAFDKALNGRAYFAFRNLPHFCHVVSKMTQKQDSKCGISYEKALGKLLRGESDFPKAEQESIRNLVRQNLHKRGLITEEVYEAYRYTVDGTQVGVDVGKYANGEADCVISPAREYIDFFYELYVSVSYSWTISNEIIRANCAKLLATIEELERQHIFIKISVVLPIRSPCGDERNLFADIPLFSHKDAKSVDTMSAVINDRLLRKFFFAMMEAYYGEELSSNYGFVVDLPTAMSIGNTFDEVAFFQNVTEQSGAGLVQGMAG
jgi:hypothetical protein